MADYSHQAMGDAIARVMDNVIARYMADHEWYGTWDDGFHGNCWDRRLPGKFEAREPVRIRQNVTAQSTTSPPPPGAVYIGDETEGSVLFHVYEVVPNDIYRPWVERVNEAFRGWRSLPDPADFQPVIGHLEQAVDELTPEAQSDGGYTFVNVDVTSAMELMRTWISPQGDNSSDLLYAFDAAYGIGRITGVMTNQAQVAAGLGYTVAGEKLIWTNARRDIITIANQGADALDPAGGGAGMSIDFDVVKAFVSLLDAFTPAKLNVLFTAVSAGLGFLDAITPQQQTDSKRIVLDGWTAEEMFTSLEQAIKDLERAIFNEELELVDKLRTLREILGSRPAADFHLHPSAGIDEPFQDAAEIRFNSAAVRRVGTENVPTVAAAFLRAAEEAAARTGPGIWTRDNLIGYRDTGAHNQWSKAIEEFDAVATGSARELVEAGKILAVAAGWIEDADVEAGLALQGLDDELERGETGWSPS